jgi:hypothetical protein
LTWRKRRFTNLSFVYMLFLLLIYIRKLLIKINFIHTLWNGGGLRLNFFIFLFQTVNQFFFIVIVILLNIIFIDYIIWKINGKSTFSSWKLIIIMLDVLGITVFINYIWILIFCLIISMINWSLDLPWNQNISYDVTHLIVRTQLLNWLELIYYQIL